MLRNVPSLPGSGILADAYIRLSGAYLGFRENLDLLDAQFHARVHGRFYAALVVYATRARTKGKSRLIPIRYPSLYY